MQRGALGGCREGPAAGRPPSGGDQFPLSQVSAARGFERFRPLPAALILRVAA